MELRDYLHFSRKSSARFADELNITRSYMSRILHGHIKPGKILARYIVEVTGGEVTLKDLGYDK